MLKQSIIYLLLSILVVVFSSYVHYFIVYVDIFYTYVNLLLAPIFNNSSTGVLIRKVIVLTFLPAIIAALPALIYRAIKGQQMPYFIETTWLLWLVIVLSKVLIQ